MKCPYCGNETNQKVCPQCKAELPKEKTKEVKK